MIRVLESPVRVRVRVKVRVKVRVRVRVRVKGRLGLGLGLGRAIIRVLESHEQNIFVMVMVHSPHHPHTDPRRSHPHTDQGVQNWRGQPAGLAADWRCERAPSPLTPHPHNHPH